MALAPVKKGGIVFIPKRWARSYTARLRDEHDWNISRQIWWGHRLPVWFCATHTGGISHNQFPISERKEEKLAGEEKKPKKRPFCKKCGMKQSEEVLDAWFSSALWPFAALGWPKKTRDMQTFFPTQILSTARDIISIWVARMVFSSWELLQKNPFAKVYIHATVLAKDGRRMSKSLGTGVDPHHLI